MASVLRGVAGRIVTGVSQVVSIFTPRTTLLHCNSLTLSPRLLSTSKPVSSCVAGIGRPLCNSIAPFTSPSVFSLAPGTSILSRVGSFIPVTFTQTRDYHVRQVLKRRCEGCYFVRRKGRMFVECKLKPRHRQMQMMAKRNLWRDDYTKGNVAKAVFWKYAEKRYYKLGDNEFARHDWLKGKIGVTV